MSMLLLQLRIYAWIGAVSIALIFLPTCVRADVSLNVDFGTQDRAADDTGYSPSDTQAGFNAFVYGPEMTASDYDYATVPPGTDPPLTKPPSITKTYDGIAVTVAAVLSASNGVPFYDYGDVSGTLGDLAEDFVASYDHALTLTFSGLTAAEYEITTYHHRPVLPTPNIINSISVDTGSGYNDVVHDLDISDGFDPATVSSATFQWTANGTDDVTILFASENNGLPLNGFELREVPEPSSILLFAMTLSLLAVFRRINFRE